MLFTKLRKPLALVLVFLMFFSMVPFGYAAEMPSSQFESGVDPPTEESLPEDDVSLTEPTIASSEPDTDSVPEDTIPETEPEPVTGSSEPSAEDVPQDGPGIMGLSPGDSSTWAIGSTQSSIMLFDFADNGNYTTVLNSQVIMTEKRMAGEYEIVQAISVGPTEIVLGYSPQNEDLPYMTAFCTQNELFTAYQHCIADDSYPHILGIFSERMTDAVKELERQLSAENKAAVDNRPYNHQKCLSTDQCNLVPHADDLHQKVVIIKPDVLKPEYQLATRQLYLCTGGFGASPNSRGSACFCTSLFSGKHSRFERSDILATLEADAVPKWAQEKLREALQSQQKKDKSKEAAR